MFDRSIRTKQQAISAILDRLVDCKALPSEHRDGALAAILQREERGSTGIGRGVAIPNAKYPGLENMVGAIVTFAAGVDFDSLDGEPVHSVCLLVSPADRPGEHHRVLECVSRRLRETGGDKAGATHS